MAMSVGTVIYNCLMIFIQDVFFFVEQQNALFYTKQSINQRAAENQRFVINLVDIHFCERN